MKHVTLDFVLRALSAVAMTNCDDLWWRTDNEYAPLTLFVECGDFFWWGTADCEELTPDNIGELERAMADVRAAGDETGIYGASLFCARQRKLRPQGCCYPERRELWSLFDACGPEREIDVCNPYPPGGRRK